jgi:hypothetical protein
MNSKDDSNIIKNINMDLKSRRQEINSQNIDDNTNKTIRRRSPMHNTESKDYNPKDIYARGERVAEMTHIIADSFKPTMNKWIPEDKQDSKSHLKKPQ